MATSTLAALSNDLADLTAAGAASVVQVSGARRPASGIVHGADTIITTARAIGREDGLQVRLPDDTTVDADLAGWDPSSGIALLRSRAPLNLAPPAVSNEAARTGQVALALARSWSNVITASAGIVAVVGGPLRTGRRRQLERVIRITAPLHDGFAGGAVFDASGTLLGIATAAQIRGYGSGHSRLDRMGGRCAASGLRHAAARLHRGRRAAGRLPQAQRAGGRERALLVIGSHAQGPAASAGIKVGDLILEVDGKPLASSEELLDRLRSAKAGETIALSPARGGTALRQSIVVGERQ